MQFTVMPPLAVLCNDDGVLCTQLQTHCSYSFVHQPILDLLSPSTNVITWKDAEIVIIKNNELKNVRMLVCMDVRIPLVVHIANGSIGMIMGRGPCTCIASAKLWPSPAV
jgi:hypothetical protein